MELVVKEGFKNTEVGLIPIDWDFTKIEEHIDLLTGFPFPSSKYSSDGIRLLKGANVKRGQTDWQENLATYWNEDVNKYKQYELADGDLVIAMDGSLVGRSYAMLNPSDLPALLLQRVARIRSKKIDIRYLKFFVGSDWFVKYCDSVKTVTAIPHISPKDIRLFKIPLPPTLEEQKAIASALSDVDALISNLDKLITKKKAIKQGAMQQLLTAPHKGGQRLDGFSGEWVEKTIGKLGNTFGGMSGKTKKDFQDGKFPYITFLNVMNNSIIDTSIFEYVDIKTGEQQNKAKKGDLFFNTSSETPEEVGMCAVLMADIENLFLNSFCFGFRLKEDSGMNGLFFSYLINSEIGRALFLSLAQGATRYNLSKSNFNKLIIEVPNIEEQEAIAQILTDMDTDIQQLEAKKSKFQDIKQGMMQELLTGKTRLV